MPIKRNKPAVDMTLPDIPSALLDQFVTGPMTAEAVEAATHKFKKAIIERALGAEMSHHLGYAPGEAKPEDVTNHRHGGGSRGTGCVRARAVGAEIPDRDSKLAKGMGTCHPVLRLSAANPPRHLHHQRDRERACQAAQDHQDTQPFPK